ncbi:MULTISPECIES: XRE family transcriptional regulator [unclassified Pseudomonas]|uniref:helix-turn-helix domain-containing protein n=1 Tax=unclassified Pseudomonas TaxID=196821 RepID=UPI002B23239F|nr:MULTISPECIES: XRE family transcriptional regulator [unclassified Pseudomonas]MEA9977120.1 XRE family transcriptional regulator [Pseudomonas sp. RTS4]MEB0196906.1 XRE family transcriptional regulator [Pseudomonas sp. 5S4]MEB0245851.1 XRE family transcriptional regulator [Pseudomonas sp. 10S5]
MNDRTGLLPLGDEFSPDKLRLARCAAGRSLAEIGELLGVTRQYAHKLEVNAVPSRMQLAQLCETLGVHESFFFAPRRGSVELEQCHFRSVRASSQTLKKTIAAQVEMFELLIDELDKEVAFPTVSFSMLDEPVSGIGKIEQVAEKFRREQGLGIGPLSSVTKLAEKVGALVVNLAEADDKVDAFSLFNKRPLIVRNTAKLNPCRQRFDLAHELGHLIMHQGIETGCRDTEDQANQFASALLMPRASFAAEFPPMRGKYLNWSALKELKLRWKVSFKALIYRAQSLDLLTAEQAKSGFTYLNRKGFTKHEEFDELIPMESPMLVQRALNLLDYGSWKRVLTASGLASDTVSMQYMLQVPASPLRLVQ